MTHPKLQAAIDAVEDLMSDINISAEETLELLEELVSRIEMHVDAINELLESEE
jgi:hypothetical protein